jgi:hypothetical protein
MLTKIYIWLKPGGAFAFNLANTNEKEIHGAFLDHYMSWSSYDSYVTDKDRELLGEKSAFTSRRSKCCARETES